MQLCFTMATVLGVEFAPMSVPFRRRLQTLALAWHMYTLLFSLFIPFLCLILFRTSWWTLLLYGAWILYDFGRSSRGSRPWKFLRGLAVWRYIAEYFPMKLIKTVDLDPSRNYILGYHPHGIGSIGAFISFTTEGTGFSQKFPGINSYLCTLYSNFVFPFRREYLMLLGKW